MNAQQDDPIRTWNPYLDAARAVNFGRPDTAAMDAYAKKIRLTRSRAPFDRAEMDELVRISTAHLYTRDKLTAEYAWAIPDEDALSIVGRYSPLIEIGAGNGYWAALLRERGVDILAFDLVPPTTPNHGNDHCRNEVGVGTTWTKVLPGGPEKVTSHSGRTLFLCWPPYDELMASRCLCRYVGNVLVYVGEGRHGCTGDEDFHDMLARDWTMRLRHPLHTWDRIHDWLFVYERNTRRRREEIRR